ncbi:MAG: 30S ribosomal protein S26e [Candidatus Geothermarchaeales archaeon]
MPKKRKSRGRYKGKGKKGRAGYVTCSNCGARIPRDKAKRLTRFYSPVDRTLAKELEKQGALIQRQKVVKFYCISCAVHYGVVKIGGLAEKVAKIS